MVMPGGPTFGVYQANTNVPVTAPQKISLRRRKKQYRTIQRLTEVGPIGPQLILEDVTARATLSDQPRECEITGHQQIASRSGLLPFWEIRHTWPLVFTKWVWALHVNYQRRNADSVFWLRCAAGKSTLEVACS